MDSPLLHSKSRVSSSFIRPHPTQLPPRFNRHLNINPNSQISTRNKLIVFSISLFSLLFFFSAALRLRHSPTKPPNRNPSPYGVIIYSSTKFTEIHVFASLDPNSGSLKKVGPSLGGDSERDGETLSELVEFAKGRVPRSEWEKTKLQMMGDEDLKGVEMVDMNVFFDTCKRVLRASRFLFKDDWVTLLEGKQEAVYDWVAANYALGNLGKEQQKTNGIVKLGGTSMQVTVSSSDPELVSISRIIKLAGVTYNLYTESRPYLGQDAMWKSPGQMHNSKDLQSFSSSEEDMAGNPCVPKGYKLTVNASDEKVVAGNFSLCTSYVRAFLNRSQDKNCLQPPCENVLSSPIKLRGMPIPLDRVFFISEFFGWVRKTSLSELEAAGHHFCEDDWYKLKSKYSEVDDRDLAKHCFSSAYIMVLLLDNVGISMTDKRIGFSTPSEIFPPSWIYGAFVLQIMQEPLEMGKENSEEIVGNDVVTYLSLFTVLLIAVLGAVFLMKCQKPQLKTVYDLQKGHYIVTRLPR